MNSLEIFENGIICSKNDFDEFSKKESVRILVVSDSHGRIDILKRVIQTYGFSCDALIFCGDGINDLFLILSKSSSDFELKKCIPPLIIFVRGNNDGISYSFFDGKNEINARIPNSQTLKVLDKKIFITHGNSFSVYYGTENLAFTALEENGAQIALFGHTHIPSDEITKKVRCINPGSISLPRGGFPKTCSILTMTPKITDVNLLQI